MLPVELSQWATVRRCAVVMARAGTSRGLVYFCGADSSTDQSYAVALAGRDANSQGKDEQLYTTM